MGPTPEARIGASSHSAREYTARAARNHSITIPLVVRVAFCRNCPSLDKPTCRRRSRQVGTPFTMLETAIKTQGRSYTPTTPVHEAAETVVGALLEGRNRYSRMLQAGGLMIPDLTWKESCRIGTIMAQQPCQYRDELDERLMALGILEWWEGPGDKGGGVGIHPEMYVGGSSHVVIPWLDMARKAATDKEMDAGRRRWDERRRPG